MKTRAERTRERKLDTIDKINLTSPERENKFSDRSRESGTDRSINPPTDKKIEK